MTPVDGSESGHQEYDEYRLSGAAILASIFLCAMLGLSGVTYWNEWRRELDRTEALARALSTAAAEQIGGSLRTIDLLIQHVGQYVIANGEKNTPVVAASLDIQSRTFPEMDALIIADKAGRARNDRDGKSWDVSRRDFFALQKRMYRNDQVVLDGPLKDPNSGQWQVILSRPLMDEADRFQGVAAAALRPSFFADPLHATGMKNRGTVTLVNVNHVVFGRFPEGDKWIGAVLPRGTVPPESLVENSQITRRTYGLMDGIDAIAAFHPVRNYPLVAIAAIPMEDVQAAWWQHTWRGIAISGSLGVVMVYFAILFDRRERQRRRATIALQRLNLELENRVAERTESLRNEVTERTQAEARTAKVKEAYRNLFGGAIEGILIHRNFIPILANDSCAHLFGYKSAEAILALPSILEMVVPGSRDGLIQATREAMALGQPATIEFEGAHRGGEILWCLNSIRPVEWEGQPAIQAAFVNITATKCWQARMTEAKEAAETASLLKSRFLAVASHDLRQPAQALAFYINVLSRRIEGAEVEAIVHRIAESTDSLNRLLDSLLDMSKLEAGVVRAELQPVALGELLDRLWSLNVPVAEEAGVSLTVVPAGRHGLSDPILLERILQNLITNAIRYTPSGGKVLVGCQCRNGQILIKVLDSGRGIPDHALAHVFEEFFRVDDATAGDGSRPGVGLGLGLSIVHRLCELMGHRLEVTSRVGRGTMFVVTLSEAVPSAEPVPPRPVAPPLVLRPGTRVLIIDNDPAMRDSLGLQLREWGLDVSSASSSEEALAVVRRIGSPDLVLSDFRLDGGETGVAVALRLEQALGRVPPLILLTADTAPAEIPGPMVCQRTLHKPVRPEVLRAALAECLAETSPPTGFESRRG
ncbi:MAG: ATP-binding protein [Alphaproteobacteria bacterium]